MKKKVSTERVAFSRPWNAKLVYNSFAEKTRPVRKEVRKMIGVKRSAKIYSQTHKQDAKHVIRVVCEKEKREAAPKFVLTVNMGVHETICVSHNDPRHCDNTQSVDKSQRLALITVFQIQDGCSIPLHGEAAHNPDPLTAIHKQQLRIQRSIVLSWVSF